MQNLWAGIHGANCGVLGLSYCFDRDGKPRILFYAVEKRQAGDGAFGGAEDYVLPMEGYQKVLILVCVPVIGQCTKQYINRST